MPPDPKVVFHDASFHPQFNSSKLMIRDHGTGTMDQVQKPRDRGPGTNWTRTKDQGPRPGSV